MPVSTLVPKILAAPHLFLQYPQYAQVLDAQRRVIAVLQLVNKTPPLTASTLPPLSQSTSDLALADAAFDARDVQRLQMCAACLARCRHNVVCVAGTAGGRDSWRPTATSRRVRP